MMKTIAVYCGSSPGHNPLYGDAAQELGRVLVRREIALVYGGGRLGLMGQIADSVLFLGGRVIGVIPESLKQKEIVHGKLTELRVVKTMHERKAVMASLSDAFIAMPGGFGTLDEMMEMITWTQLGLQAKPLGFLNTAGFYGPLFQFLRLAQTEGFINADVIRSLALEENPEKLLESLSAPVLLSTPWPRIPGEELRA
jgi:uncharacterized protein (TIGR00730 family)